MRQGTNYSEQTGTAGWGAVIPKVPDSLRCDTECFGDAINERFTLRRLSDETWETMAQGGVVRG